MEFGLFPVWVVINIVSGNTSARLLVNICIHFSWVSISGVEFLDHKECICSTLVDTASKYSKVVFSSLHDHFLYPPVLFAPHPPQCLALSVFSTLAILLDIEWSFIVVLFMKPRSFKMIKIRDVFPQIIALNRELENFLEMKRFSDLICCLWDLEHCVVVAVLRITKHLLNSHLFHSFFHSSLLLFTSSLASSSSKVKSDGSSWSWLWATVCKVLFPSSL